ncbi:hypothetical protein ACWIGI_21190 [Nocardia sp. NPDC055321]
MNVKYLATLPAAVMAVAPVFVVAGTPSAAAAAPRAYVCTAETWGGDPLPAVTVEARKNLRQAKGLAQTEWRGTAKYATIECKPA